MHFVHQPPAGTLVDMSVDTVVPPSTVGDVARRRPIVTGVLTMLASGAGNQVGAGLGAHAFPTIGPAGGGAVRQFVAAPGLLPPAPPPVWRVPPGQWGAALGGGPGFPPVEPAPLHLDRPGRP